MATQDVEALIEGGKASAAPPLGPALGPLGVNIGAVIAEINKKTGDFKGMQVPVTVKVDTDSKEFTISIGTPPASALIKKEAGVNKGSGKAKEDFVADLKIEQIIKVAKMKEDALMGATFKAKVKEVVGTCVSMGVMVEGVPAKEAFKMIDDGNFDEKIKARKTELSAEEIKEQEEERKHMQEELKDKREQFETEAKRIVAEMAGKDNKDIRAKLKEAQLPEEIINQFAPKEEVKKEGDAKKEEKPAEKKKVIK
ncbi:MAG: 50S ribosomal protein L11 [Nanoarchaeota archaeon]|nr:50S ribosomal protein L11 [Nanoarchaeota archaeon]